MKMLGKHLVERGVLSQAQLDEATQSQVVFGGRLGTNLVELGYLRIDELERHLSGLLGVPLPPPEWIERPGEEARRAVPVELVEKYRVMPLRLEKRTLHVAMLDPRNPGQLDDLGFGTGLRIQPYVLAEVRLTALLEHHYGIRRELRYIHLGPDLARGRQPGPARGPSARPVEQAAEPLAQPPDPARDAGPELIDEETFASLHEAPPLLPEDGISAGRPEPGGARRASALAPAPAEAAGRSDEAAGSSAPASGTVPDAVALEAQLARPADRDGVGRATLRIARLYARAAALFVVRGGVVSGFRGDGDAVPERLDGILVPLESGCALVRPAATGAPFRSPAPRGGIDGKLLAALSRSEAREVLVHPVAIRGRVVNLLYADNGPDPLAETSVAALSALCALAARAYEQLIVERKRRLDAA